MTTSIRFCTLALALAIAIFSHSCTKERQPETLSLADSTLSDTCISNCSDFQCVLLNSTQDIELRNTRLAVYHFGVALNSLIQTEESRNELVINNSSWDALEDGVQISRLFTSTSPLYPRFNQLVKQSILNNSIFPRGYISDANLQDANFNAVEAVENLITVNSESQEIVFYKLAGYELDSNIPVLIIDYHLECSNKDKALGWKNGISKLLSEEDMTSSYTSFGVSHRIKKPVTVSERYDHREVVPNTKPYYSSHKVVLLSCGESGEPICTPTITIEWGTKWKWHSLWKDKRRVNLLYNAGDENEFLYEGYKIRAVVHSNYLNYNNFMRKDPVGNHPWIQIYSQ